MAEYVAIPKLGMSMIDAMLVEWKYLEGDQIEKGDEVLIIETDKTKWGVESPANGFLHILVEVDVKMPVGRVVGLIAATKAELAALQKEPPKESYTQVEAAPGEAATLAATAVATASGSGSQNTNVRISPVARKMAEENIIDISRLTGSGPDGRIVREDIEKAIEAKKSGVPAKGSSAEVYAGKKIKEVIQLKGMRRAISEHMHRSLAISAQLTSMWEIYAEELIKLRNDLLTQEKAVGTRITYTDIMVLIAAKALKLNPIMNSSLIDNDIKIWEDVNIAVAVAVEAGLIVPVIKSANRKSLAEISKEMKSLIEKARTGKLTLDDLSDGTFTISNLGVFGGRWGMGTPIINQPQSAILGTGAIIERPVVRNGQIVIGQVMTANLTFDHRVIDGAPAAKFMADFTQLVESPGRLLL